MALDTRPPVLGSSRCDPHSRLLPFLSFSLFSNLSPTIPSSPSSICLETESHCVACVGLELLVYLLPQHLKCWVTWIYHGGLKNTVFEQRQVLSIGLGTAGVQNREEGTWLLSPYVVLSPKGPEETTDITVNIGF